MWHEYKNNKNSMNNKELVPHLANPPGTTFIVQGWYKVVLAVKKSKLFKLYSVFVKKNIVKNLINSIIYNDKVSFLYQLIV